MKKLISMLLITLMAFSLVACGGGDDVANTDPGTSSADPGQSGQTASADKDTLRVISSYDPGTFEPGNNDEQGYNRITRQIYECLFMLDNEGNVQPWLATGYVWEDPTHLVVSLREDVKFSTGDPFTAEDVQFTITRAKEEALPISPSNTVVIDECEIRDEHTIVIGLSDPMGTFPAHLANPECVIASKKAFEEGGGDYLGASVVGTGPYKLAEYVEGDMIKFTANEYYWREGEPKTPNLEYRLVSSDTTRATEAKAKGADIILYPNPREHAAIDAVDGISVKTVLSASTTYLLINSAKAPMDNPKVREAVARAINVKGTVALAYGDFGSAATGFVCPGILGYNEETYQKYYGAGSDIETAKKLLTEAGYPNGLELEITIENNDSNRHDMAEAMQAQLAEAGITLKLNEMASAPMREYLANGNHQLCIYGFTSLTFEADGMLAQLQPGSSALARIAYDRQEFFDLFTKGCATEDRAARGQIWEECMEMLMGDYVMVPLWHKALNAAVMDNVKGFELTRDYEEHYFQYVYKE